MYDCQRGATVYKSEIPTNGAQSSAAFTRVSEDEGSFSLSDLTRVVLKRLWVILLVVCVVVGAAVGASLWQTPTYEASAQVWVDQKQGDQQTNLAGTVEGLQTIILTMIHAIDSRPVAEEAIQRLNLDMTPAELLDNLTAEQVESTNFIVLTYQGNDPVEATKIVNTVGQVLSEFISESSQLTVNVWEKAVVPVTPVSPHPLRNGLFTLVIGLGLCGGLALALAHPLAARAAGILSERVRVVRQGVGQARLPGRRHLGSSEAERIKEQELLEALDRRGKLTALEAALESSLSVEEADRMLYELALRGHLEITLEHGRLLYSFWKADETGGSRGAHP
jgi:capsular polysaccharide biosynthesis protein